MKNLNKLFIGEIFINIFLIVYALGFLLIENKIYNLSSLVFGIFLILIAVINFIKFLKKENNKYNYLDLAISIILLLLGIALFISLDILKFNISIVLILYILISLINKFPILERLKKNSNYFYLNLFNYFIMFLSPLFLLIDEDSNVKIFIMLMIYILANINFIFITKIEGVDNELR